MNKPKTRRKRKKQVTTSRIKKLPGKTYVIQTVTKDGITNIVKSKVDRRPVENEKIGPPCLRQHLVTPLS